MTYKGPSGDGVAREYPKPAVVDAAVARFHAGQELDGGAFDTLANMPLRTRWTTLEWDRGVVTNVGTPLPFIPLPERPGTALYIHPDIRRLCAAVDESRQGMWEQTLLVGASAFLRRLIGSGLDRLPRHPDDIYAYENGLDQVLGEEHGLQLVCFDSMNDLTDPTTASRIVRAAERTLEPGGLLIIGGTTVTDIGHRCVAGAVDLALTSLDLRYEQEWPSGAALSRQAIFSK